MSKVISIEGYTPEQILALSEEQLDAFVFCDEPIILRAGTAEILGEFRIYQDHLEVELAQIEGGGEGVLPTLWLLAERYAARKKLSHVDWFVHALTCAKPNLKLKRVLERKGFTIELMRSGTEAYFYRHKVPEHSKV
ncbi:MAG: hypothetical protein SFY80_11980 [Verrucomicrobiota bacterium]|nr:hypothetical protein [Verrucomicrobiota bacterium]